MQQRSSRKWTVLILTGFLIFIVGIAACIPGATVGVAAAGPDSLLGIWVPNAAPQQLVTLDGSAPPLKEAAAKVYAERKRLRENGDASFDQTTWCAGPGMPRILTMPYPFEIRRDGDFMAFIHGWYRWHRVVDMSGGAVDPPLPLTMGFPKGNWEGDTLVIRTVGLIDATVLDAAGMPHSEQMTLTERLRVLDDGRLEDRLRVEDPNTFTKPWESVLYFHRDAAARVTDDVCPDRIADGQPAVLTTRSTVASSLPKDAPASVPSNTAANAPRISGMWEPKTFGFMVPEAPLSKAGRDMVDRGAAAMRDGKIMHTALDVLSSRRDIRHDHAARENPHAAIPGRTDDSLRNAPYGSTRPHEHHSSQQPGVQLRGGLRGTLGGQHAGGRYPGVQRLRGT
jgi:hypothetical protein